MIVTRSIEFPMGHRLKDHPGRCRHIHGHNYRVVAEVEGEPSSSTGMVLDFSDLKKVMHEVFDRYDHAFMLQTSDPLLQHQLGDVGGDRIVQMKEPPTAENLARLWYFQLDQHLPLDANLRALEVFESSVTSARYEWKEEVE